MSTSRLLNVVSGPNSNGGDGSYAPPSPPEWPAADDFGDIFWRSNISSIILPSVGLMFIICCIIMSCHAKRRRRRGHTRMCFGLLSVVERVPPPNAQQIAEEKERRAVAAVKALPSAPWDGVGRDEFECAICLKDVAIGELVTSMPKCPHAFHEACLSRWFLESLKSKRRRCPLCNSDALNLDEAAPSAIELSPTVSSTSSRSDSSFEPAPPAEGGGVGGEDEDGAASPSSPSASSSSSPSPSLPTPISLPTSPPGATQSGGSSASARGGAAITPAAQQRGPPFIV